MKCNIPCKKEMELIRETHRPEGSEFIYLCRDCGILVTISRLDRVTKKQLEDYLGIYGK